MVKTYTWQKSSTERIIAHQNTFHPPAQAWPWPWLVSLVVLRLLPPPAQTHIKRSAQHNAIERPERASALSNPPVCCALRRRQRQRRRRQRSRRARPAASGTQRQRKLFRTIVVEFITRRAGKSNGSVSHNARAHGAVVSDGRRRFGDDDGGTGGCSGGGGRRICARSPPAGWLLAGRGGRGGTAVERIE